MTSVIYFSFVCAESLKAAPGSVTSSCWSSPTTRTLWSCWDAPVTSSTSTASVRTRTRTLRSQSAASPRFPLISTEQKSCESAKILVTWDILIDSPLKLRANPVSIQARPKRVADVQNSVLERYDLSYFMGSTQLLFVFFIQLKRHFQTVFKNDAVPYPNTCSTQYTTSSLVFRKFWKSMQKWFKFV